MPIPYPAIEADSRILFAAGYEASKPQFKGGGVVAPRLYGSRPNSPILVLEYRYLSEADTFSILTAWNNSLSGFFGLTLPSQVACGITSTDLAERIVSASAQGWRFAEKPRIENLPAKRHNVTVRLEGGFYALPDAVPPPPPPPPAALFLEMQGANGSTSFVDTGGFNHTITAFGNAQISNNELLLTGEGGYLLTERNEELVLGRGGFRIQGEIKYEASGEGSMTIFSYTKTDVWFFGYLFLEISFGSNYFKWSASRDYSPFYAFRIDWSQPDAYVAPGEKVAFALVRDENGTSLELNGVRLQTDFGEGEYYPGVVNRSGELLVPIDYVGDQVAVGNYDGLYGGEFDSFGSFSGTIDNFRIIKSPPPPMTVVLFLEMQGANGSNLFVDSSAFNHEITAEGNAQISNNELLLTEEGDLIRTKSNANFILEKNYFRIEGEIKYNAVSGNQYFNIFVYLGGVPRFGIYFGSGYFGWRLVTFGGGEFELTIDWSQPDAYVAPGEKVAFALVRDENGTSLELNGVRLQTDFGEEDEYYTELIDFDADRVVVGGGWWDGGFRGTIDNFKITRPAVPPSP